VTALIGRLLIYVALACAASGALLAFAARGDTARLKLSRRLGYGFAGAFILATLWMIIGLVRHDFSISYVAHVGSLATPLHITIVSLWSSLEGSILFWAAVLSIYSLFFLRAQRGREADPRSAYSLGIILVVGAFFALLISAVANPFLATPLPIPTDGNGPNPLLQNHALMIIHPPMLYLGYVGMTIPFAMAIGALLVGRTDPDWMRSMRRWMMVPWGFLTAGIVLGGWWAYEVLGWGGWWGWDPVENASLLPWLAATAFLHVSMLEERRGLYKGWTFTLVLVTFALTVLGTFMTRSGVFNSVHAFTQSPIGPTFLAFLAVVVLGSVVLLSLRLHRLEPGRPMRSALSREAAFVFQNLLFVSFTFTVLLGTAYPLVAEAVRGIKVSVGGPFFSDFVVPIGIAILFLMGIGPALPWGAATPREALRALVVPLGMGGLVVVAFVLGGVTHGWALTALGACGFAAAVSLRELAAPVRARIKAHGESVFAAVAGTFRHGRRRLGGHIVHLGVTLLGGAIAISSADQKMVEAVLHDKDSFVIGDYWLQYTGARVVSEPHRERHFADFVVVEGTDELGVMSPAMNRYSAAMNAIGTPAVRTSASHDLYLSIMHLDDNEVGVRAFINPGMAWLWIGAGVMLLGCAIAVVPERRVRPVVVVAT